MHSHFPPQQPFAGDPLPPPTAAPPTTAGDFVPVEPPETWPKVIGILGIIFGALGLISSACNGLSLFGMGFFTSFIPAEQQAELEAQMQAMQKYMGLQILAAGLEAILAVMLLIGSIQLLQRKRASVGVLKLFAWSDLAVNTFAAAVTYFASVAQMQNMSNDPNATPMPAGAGQAIAVGSAVFAWVFSSIWPVFLLIWFARPKIKETVRTWP